MAEQKGVSYTNYAADPKKMVDASSWHGRVRSVYDSFDCTVSTLAIADTLKMGRIPNTARIIGGYLVSSAATSTSQFAVTVGATAVRAAAVLSGANVFHWLMEGTGTELATESDVTITVTVQAQSTGTLSCVVLYVVD